MTPRMKAAIKKELESAFIACGGICKNHCDPVSNEFAVRMEEEFDWMVHSPVEAPVNGAKHYVAVVDFSEVETAKSEKKIVVDRTIQQFDDSYPSVVVEPLYSDTVSRLYDEVRL